MKQLCTEKEARLTYLKRELIRSVIDAETIKAIVFSTRSRYFNQRNCHYKAPTGVIPQRVKKLILEIEELEKDMGPRKAEELHTPKRRIARSGKRTKAPPKKRMKWSIALKQ